MMVHVCDVQWWPQSSASNGFALCGIQINSSLDEGVIGFFFIILNSVSDSFNLGKYLDTLLFSERLLKKYLTILSSNEWNVTTTKIPSFFNIFDAIIKP